MSSKIYIVGLAAAACVVVGCMSIVLWPQRPVIQPPPVPVPDLQNDVSLQQECAQLFKNILKIQDDREEFRKQFDQVQQAFNNEEIGRQKMSEASSLWLSNENSLATEAASLYSTGHEKGCFQKVTQ